MIDNKTMNRKINELFVIYKKTRNNKVLSILNNRLKTYGMEKTYNTLTDNINLTERKEVVIDSITEMVIKIDKFDFVKYTAIQIFAQILKQNIIAMLRTKNRTIKLITYTDDLELLERLHFNKTI